MTDQQRIAEIDARCEAATPGPWYVPLYGYSIDDNETNLFYAFGMGEQVNADMRFVAASREDIPFLLSQLAAKDAEIERLSQLAMMREGEIGDRDREIGLMTEAQRWIPVTERLPEDGQRILICEDGAVYSVKRGHDLGFKPTHWMPLPAAIEKGE